MVKRFEVTLRLDKNKTRVFNVTAKDKHQAIACAIHWAWGEAAELVKYQTEIIAFGREMNFIDYCVDGIMRSGYWDEVTQFKGEE